MRSIDVALSLLAGTVLAQWFYLRWKAGSPGAKEPRWLTVAGGLSISLQFMMIAALVGESWTVAIAAAVIVFCWLSYANRSRALR